ncbi:GIY-YIG nuclease family protein [Herpetosiphon geysericola]|uniref:GIY-YIG nuclease family protein n=1 Tax=Herpetosiphon geysericola TaxID=70996 RepID=UPI0006C92709|nr:hypothetical protein [Herpetosiphon geysericola]
MDHQAVDQLLQPKKILPVVNFLAAPELIPAQPGIYGWWFKTIPPQVPNVGCLHIAGWTLLYLGISPARNNPTSRQNLRKRLRDHMLGRANSSTLRLSLGCLLSEQLNLKLAAYGPSKYVAFGEGEKRLSQWLAANTGLSWLVHPQPWLIKPELLQHYVLPLNIKGNDHPFVTTLEQIRAQATLEAR